MASMEAQTKLPRSYKLTEECLRLMALLAAKLGVNKSAVIELAVRDYARSQGVVVK